MTPSVRATEHEYQCQTLAWSAAKVILQREALAAKQEAARLLQEESARLGAGSLSDHLRKAGEDLLREPVVAAEVYNLIRSLKDWAPRGHLAKKSIEVATSDALAWEIIESMCPGTDLDVVFSQLRLREKLALDDHPALKSQLHNTCLMKIRHVVRIGHCLQGYAISSRAELKAAQRGKGKSYWKKWPQKEIGHVPAEGGNIADSDASGSSDPYLRKEDKDEYIPPASPPAPRDLTDAMAKYQEKQRALEVENEQLKQVVQSLTARCGGAKESEAAADAFMDSVSVVAARGAGVHEEEEDEEVEAQRAESTRREANGEEADASVGIISPAAFASFDEQRREGPAWHSTASVVTRSSLMYLQHRPVPPCPAQPCPAPPCAFQHEPGALLLDEAYQDLSIVFQTSPEEGAHMDRSRAIQWLYESAPKWREQYEQALGEANVFDNPELVTKWIRSRSPDSQLQRHVLLVSCIFGVQRALLITEHTFDDWFSGAVYDAIQEHISTFGLHQADKQEIVERLLMARFGHFRVRWYVSYMALLGQLLEGAGSFAAWARAEEQKQSLHESAVAKVLEIAGWWHRQNFHTESCVQVVQQAFASLLQIFRGAQSLGACEGEIHNFVWHVLHDYKGISDGLDSAKSLLSFGYPHR